MRYYNQIIKSTGAAKTTAPATRLAVAAATSARTTTAPAITTTATSISLVMLVLMSALLLAISANPASARYLPTRADNTDVEVLKTLIRGLLTQSLAEQSESRWLQQPQQASSINGAGQLDSSSETFNGENNNSRFYRPLVVPATALRSYQTQPASAIQVGRRAMEMSVASDGDSQLRTGVGGNNIGASCCE